MVNSMKGNPTKKAEEDKRKLEDEKRRKDQEVSDYLFVVFFRNR